MDFETRLLVCESQLYLSYLCLGLLIWNWNQSSTYLVSLVKKIKEFKSVNINKLKRAWQTVSPTSLCHCSYYYHLYYFYFLCPSSHELETALPAVSLIPPLFLGSRTTASYWENWQMCPKQIKEVAHLHFNRDFQEIIITLPFLESLLYVRHCANNHFGNLKEQS